MLTSSSLPRRRDDETIITFDGATRWWVRVDGPAVNDPADLAAHEAVHRIEFAHPTPAGLVAAVRDWARQPQPPIPLYLRRPDAKTLAERGVR